MTARPSLSGPAERVCAAYSELHAIWSEATSDRFMAEGSGFDDWPWPEDENHGIEIALTYSQMHLAGVAVTVGSHLVSLSDVYRYRWPYQSAFTLARGVLEALGLYMWILAPTASHRERAVRTLRMLAWADFHAKKAGDEGFGAYRNAAETAAIPVVDQRGRPPKVDGAAWSQTAVIRKGLGEEGVELYDLWSAAAHASPRSLREVQQMAIVDAGVSHTHEANLAGHRVATVQIAQLTRDGVAAWDSLCGRPDTRASRLQLLIDALCE